MATEKKNNASPFKFLDSYGQGDSAIFFGRKAESEELYERTFESNLILLYGASGTGKTSLINCGLGNLMNSTDWLPIYTRRGDDMNQSLKDSLFQSAKKKWAPDLELNQMVHSIYLDYFKPVFLIFDQFEEIFIMGSKAEQFLFFTTIKDLLESETQFKILISLREEYFALVSDFELLIPTLLSNRIRIEKMTRPNLQEVISGTTLAFDIGMKQGNETINLIIDSMSNSKEGVELAHLQIYLDQLYRNAIKRANGNEKGIQFDPDLVKETKKWADVLGNFIEEQIEVLEQELRGENVSQKGIPWAILLALITENGTKKNIGIADLKKIMEAKKIDHKTVDYCIKRFNDLRLIKFIENV